jgi:cold shock CspA family protein
MIRLLRGAIGLIVWLLEGQKDVFVHASIVERAGVRGLDEGSGLR